MTAKERQAGSPVERKRTRLLLSLDGGGVRGLSSIHILKRIMDSINDSRSEEEDELRPCDIFDLIGGTSTGGIIATMLGRLHMSVDECEAAYLKLSRQIFTPRRRPGNVIGRAKDIFNLNGRFDAEVLENVIKEELKAKLPAEADPETALLKEENPMCKVFVVTARQNNSDVALLRSFKSPRSANILFNECRIWEACRATSAATTFFDPITIGKSQQTFIDGAVIYNNPVELVHREARSLWPEDELVIISIGTGCAPGKPLGGNLKIVAEGVKKIVTQTERTAQDFYKGHPELVSEGRYFRFNVNQGLASVGLEEWKEIGAITDYTESYLEDGEVGRKVEESVEKILQVLNSSDSDEEEELNWQPQRVKISEWLSLLKFWQRQKDRLGERVGNTGGWVLETQEFKNWESSENSRLWCYGNPGAGKSVIAAIIIQHLESTYCEDKTSSNYGLAWVYGDHLSSLQNTPTLLSSILSQLIWNSKPDKELLKFYEESLDKGTRPSLAEIQYFLAQHTSRRKTFIVVDGFDEITYQMALWEALKVLPNACLLFISRKLPFTEKLFPDIPRIEIRSLREDIETYILEFIGRDYYLKQHVENYPQLKDSIFNTIIANSGGMMLMTKLLLYDISYTQRPIDVENRLGQMSENIHLQYGNIVERIRQQRPEDAALAFKCIAWMLYGLEHNKITTRELQHAVSVEEGDTEISEMSLINEDLILTVCCGLLTVEGETGAVRFLHATAYDYFRGSAVRDALFPSRSVYNMLTQTCLIYLNFDVFEAGPCMTEEELLERHKTFPFYSYAAKTWSYHLRCSYSDDSNLLALQLLRSKTKTASAFQSAQYMIHKDKPDGFICPGQENIPADRAYPAHVLWHLNSFEDSREGNIWPIYHIIIHFSLRALMPLALQDKAFLKHINDPDFRGITPLMYAARENYNDKGFTEFLLDAGADINLHFEPGLSPLWYAVNNAAVKTTFLLLSRGADLNVVDERGHSIFRRYIDPDRYAKRLTRLSSKCRNEQFRSVLHQLLAKGVDVHYRDIHGKTALHDMAVLSGCATYRMQFRKIIDMGVDVNSVDEEGNTPLHLAARDNRCVIINLLLENKADPNIRNKIGATPLHYALRRQMDSYYSHMDRNRCVKYLLEHGADTTIRTEDGLTPLFLHAAVRRDLTTIIPDPEKFNALYKETFQELLKGNKVTDVDNSGETFLHYAARLLPGDEGELRLPILVELGADISAKDNEGLTPLLVAAKVGGWGSCKALIELGASLSARCNKGKTTLHYAAENAHSEAGIELCLLGQNVKAKCNAGKLPLHYLASLSESLWGEEQERFRKEAEAREPVYKSWRQEEEEKNKRPEDFRLPSPDIYEFMETLAWATGLESINDVDLEGKMTLGYAIEMGNGVFMGILVENGARERRVAVSRKVTETTEDSD